MYHPCLPPTVWHSSMGPTVLLRMAGPNTLPLHSPCYSNAGVLYTKARACMGQCCPGKLQQNEPSHNLYGCLQCGRRRCHIYDAVLRHIRAEDQPPEADRPGASVSDWIFVSFRLLRVYLKSAMTPADNQDRTVVSSIVGLVYRTLDRASRSDYWNAINICITV